MEAYEPTQEEFAALNLVYNPAIKFFRGTGCPMCFGTGYRGRTGVFEILIIDRAVRSVISQGVTREVMQDVIKTNSNFQSMEDSLRRLVFEGKTTVSEARKTMTAIE